MKNITNNKLLTDAIIIAFISGYIYLITFYYEYGYCSYFNIPNGLISPSLNTILIFAVSFISFFLSSFYVLTFTAPLLRSLSDPKKEAIRPFLFVNFLALITSFILTRVYGFELEIILYLIGGIILINIFQYSIPLYRSIKKKNLVEGFKEYHEPEDPWDISDIFIKKFGIGIFRFLFVLLAIIGVSYLIGKGEAINKDTYYLVNNSNTVVLRIYNNIMICSPLDTSNNIISDELILLNLTKPEEIRLRKRKIGHLELSTNSNQNGKSKDILIEKTNKDSLYESVDSIKTVTQPVKDSLNILTQ